MTEVQSSSSPDGAWSVGSNTFLLFDESGSTYLCVAGASLRDCEEFYRSEEGQAWQRVDRSDKSRAAEHAAAGVPKCMSWPLPSLTVYTWGKQEVGKGGVPNRATKKYYQWCQICCACTCGTSPNNRGGCTKPRCWIAPKKWKQHTSSQAHAACLCSWPHANSGAVQGQRQN